MMIFRALFLLLLGGMTYEKVQGFISSFISAARTAIFGGENAGVGLIHSELFIIFAIIAVGFLTVTFYSELVKEATNDTLTPEKLVVALAKLFVGAMMIFFLPEILNIIFDLVEIMFNATANIKDYAAGTNPDSTINGVIIKIWHDYEDDPNKYSTLVVPLESVKNNTDIKSIYYNTHKFASIPNSGVKWYQSADTAFLNKEQDFWVYMDDYYGGLSTFNDAGPWWMSVIILVVSIVALWGTYFAVAKAVIEFTIFAFLAPIGIINLFGENNRMIGIKYLKKLLAKGMTMAAMMILLAVCSGICSGLMVNALKNAKTDLADYTVIETEEESTSSTIVNANGFLTLNLSVENDDFETIFSAGVIGKCLIMQIASLGLLLGAGKLTDEIFAS